MHRYDAPASSYKIPKLIEQAPETPVDITGEWIGSTQYSPTVKLNYKLTIARGETAYKIVSFIDPNTDLDLDVRNFSYKHPTLKFEADSGLFNGRYMIPIPFQAELVVLGDELKGHFQEIKNQNDNNITYYDYDIDFQKVK